MSHFFYVATSYGIAGATVLGLVLWVWLDGAAQRRELDRLDKAGVRRRSVSVAGDAR